MKFTLAVLSVVICCVIAQGASCPDDTYCFMNGDQVLATLSIVPHACQSLWSYTIQITTEIGGSFIIAEGVVKPTSQQEYSKTFGKGTGFVYYVSFHGVYLNAGGDAGFASAELTIPSVRHNAFVGPAYSVQVTECGVPEEIYQNCASETNADNSFSINEELYDILINYSPDNKLELYNSYGCISVISAGDDSAPMKGPLFCSSLQFSSCSPTRDLFFSSASGIEIEPIRVSFNHSEPNAEQCTQITEEHQLCIKISSGNLYLETWEYYWEAYVYYYAVLRNAAGEDISIYGSMYHYGYFPICGLWDCYLRSDDVDSYEESYISRLEAEVNPHSTGWSSGTTFTSFFTSFTSFSSFSSEGFLSSLESSLSSWISSVISSLFGSTDLSSEVSSFVSSVESAISEKEEEFPYFAYLFLFGSAFACVSANVVLVIVIAIVIYVKRAIATPSTYNAVNDTML